MGYGYEFTCLDCGYKKTVLLGVGMMYCELTPDMVKRHIRGKTMREEILSRIPDKKPVEFSHKLMLCSKCNTLGERLFVKFDDYATAYKCHRCKAVMEEVETNEVKDLNCPECGSENFLPFGHVMWD